MTMMIGKSRTYLFGPGKARVAGLLTGVIVALSGCKDLVGNPALPAGAEDPSVYNTPSGALRFARAATDLFAEQLAGFALTGGVFTDEMTGQFAFGTTGNDTLDARVAVEQTDPGISTTNRGIDQYAGLQKLRGQARLARAIVAKYAPNAPPTVRGTLFAMEGYADLMLADLYCSGVPLSTIDFENDFTYQPGSTTTAVYQAALTLLDSAAAVAGTDANLLTLARVGKGRVLLALGQYANAAQAVAGVADGQSYTIPVTFNTLATSSLVHFAEAGSAANAEGINGLPYLTNGDPRSKADTLTVKVIGVPTLTYYPRKYRTANTGVENITDSTSMVVADWIEARLIEAEAALQANDAASWKRDLDHIRATVAVDGVVGAISPVVDPGTADARLDTLFADRAEWLYLTGHRQGDLRRLVRNYGRVQNRVYPTGPHPRLGTYGASTNLPVPVRERVNSFFHGCFDRDA